MNFPKWLAAALLPLALSACQDSNTVVEKDVRMSQELAAFHQSQTVWREQRRADLLAPRGWASLTGLHWLEPGAHFLGSDADNGIQLTLGPDHLGMIELRDDGRIRFVPEQGVALTLDGEPVTGEVMLLSDEGEQKPSELGFDGGQGVLTVIHRGDRHALRIKHEQAPARVGFAGLDYWPADPDWTIEGRFIPHPPGQALEIASVIGTTEQVPNPGVIEFERAGVSHRLETIDEGGEQLFVVFADHTNGQGSYGAGRFVYVPRPDAEGRVVIDFNRSYNPPCAFTPFATCPLPPDENRLDLAITAGEKAYRPDAS
jgi:uncharacterized protein (DUF1684 family)